MQAAGFESQSALARASGVPQPTINRILKGVGKNGPEASTLAKLAAACNVSFTWLHEGTGPRTRTEVAQLPPGDYMKVVLTDEDSPNQYRIPMVSLKLQAGVTGFQTEPDRRDGGTMGLSKSWADRKGFDPEKLMAIKVRGESMEPTFYADDTVVINLADKAPVDNGVFAVNYDGEAVVKRLSRDAGQWWLMSDNPDQRKYYRRMCSGTECIIIGRIVRREGDQF